MGASGAVCGLGERPVLPGVFSSGMEGTASGSALLSMHRVTWCECGIGEPDVFPQSLEWELGATIC